MPITKSLSHGVPPHPRWPNQIAAGLPTAMTATSLYKSAVTWPITPSFPKVSSSPKRKGVSVEIACLDSSRPAALS